MLIPVGLQVRSISNQELGYIYLLNQSAISWAGRKERTVVLSLTEADYIALAEAASERLWTVGLLIVMCSAT